MKTPTKRRWMAWILEDSAKQTVALPWTRGSRTRHAAQTRTPRAARG